MSYSASFEYLCYVSTTIINISFSAGIDLDVRIWRLHTSDSCRRHIMTSKDGPRAERVNVLLLSILRSSCHSILTCCNELDFVNCMLFLYHIQYCGEPLWPRGSLLGLRLQGFEVRILCLKGRSSHHPQEVLLAQFSLYVHKSCLKPDSFIFLSNPSKQDTFTQWRFNVGRRRSLADDGPTLIRHRVNVSCLLGFVSCNQLNSYNDVLYPLAQTWIIVGPASWTVDQHWWKNGLMYFVGWAHKFPAVMN